MYTIKAKKKKKVRAASSVLNSGRAVSPKTNVEIEKTLNVRVSQVTAASI